MKKINALQDLRGIAILMVVLFHSGSTVFGGHNIFMHGSNGVLLFFIISGFIISSIHKSDSGVNQLIVFFKKRFIRVYLPYIPVFIFFVIVFNFTGKGDWYHHDTINIVKNLFLMQNTWESIHPYSWTLVYEVFYYITFGVLVILFNLSIRSYALIMITPILLSQFQDGLSNDFFVTTSFYNLYFLAGVLISHYYHQIKFKISNGMLFFIGVCFFVFPFIFDEGIFLYISTILFFIFYIVKDKSIKILRVVGNASYSIYLIHAIVISVGKYLILDMDILKFILLFSLSMLLGYIYHIYFENTIVHKTNKLLLTKNTQ